MEGVDLTAQSWVAHWPDKRPAAPRRTANMIAFDFISLLDRGLAVLI